MFGLFRGKKARAASPLVMYDVLLDWAWDELKSPKWTERFIKDAGEEHVRRLRQAASPTALSTPDQQILINAFLERREWLIDKYLRPAHDFCEVKLDMAALGDLLIFSEMLAEGMNMRAYAASMPPEPGSPRDPRRKSNELLQAIPNFTTTTKPVIIKTSRCKAPILLEGYTRVTTLLRRHQRGEIPHTYSMRCYCATNDTVSDKD